MKAKISKILVFLIVVAILVSCGESNVSKRASEYLDHIKKGEFEDAYSYISPSIRENMKFDVFSDYMIDPETDVKISETGVDFDVSNHQIFPGKEAASVYGTMWMEELDQPFRLPMLLEAGEWWIGNVVVEQESMEYPGYYVSDKLRSNALDFFDWMLDAEIEKLWNRSSKKIHSEYSISEYKKLAIATVSGKTPREEEYSIMIGPAFSTEPDFSSGEKSMKGFAFVTIGIGNLETSTQQVIVKADFVFEENEWRADFAYLEEYNPDDQ